MENMDIDKMPEDLEHKEEASSSLTTSTSNSEEVVMEEEGKEVELEERRKVAREQIGVVLSAGDGILERLVATELLAEKQRILVRAVMLRLNYQRGFKNDIEIHLAAGALRNKIGILVAQATKLLEQLDAVLSFGDGVIASERRAAAKRVQMILNLVDARFRKAKLFVAYIERLRALPPFPKKTKEQDVRMEKARNHDEEMKSNNAIKETKGQEEEADRAPSPVDSSSPVRSPKKFPAPNYEIKDGTESVVISMPLPKGFDVEKELKFSTNEKRMDSLSILGFEDPIKFSVDPRRMDLSGTTYRVVQGPQRVLRVIIPKIVRQFSPVRLPRSSFGRSDFGQIWF